jgi:pimeloyl-ACP methyl ester carboxylesterase
VLAIDTLEAIPVGGAAQWIRVRGADTFNPVLLLIQQGPGLPMINEARRFEHVLGLEQAFTVVYWDQRGCGCWPAVRGNGVRQSGLRSRVRTRGRVTCDAARPRSREPA